MLLALGHERHKRRVEALEDCGLHSMVCICCLKQRSAAAKPTWTPRGCTMMARNLEKGLNRLLFDMLLGSQ